MPPPPLYGPPRTDFGPAPAGYIPGFGRGATGFTTRGDLGPALGESVKPPPGYQSDSVDYSETSFNKFSGYTEQLFNSDTYNEEDKEADNVYAEFEAKLEMRRNKGKKKRTNDDDNKNNNKTSKESIQSQFRDLKRKLKDVSEEEWAAIPEAKDLSHRNKILKQQNDEKRQHISAATDSILTMGLSSGYVHTLDGNKSINDNGVTTPMNAPNTDLTQLGRARDQVLSLKLDKISDSVTGQTVVEPTSYLNGLNSINIHNNSDINDIKKARLLYKSAVKSNPEYAPSWIAAAMLEKQVGQMSDAKSIILKGCEACPTSEDMWIKASQLHNKIQAKRILAKAVQRIPTSVNIWLTAYKLEDDKESKKAVLRKALQIIPKSVKLWKAAIELEDPAGAILLLDCAVELLPQNAELWLALAHLETYEKAKQVLNKARRAIPTNHLIWIAAAKLEESNGNKNNIKIVIERGISSLNKYQMIIQRQTWLDEAENCEKSGCILTCRALVNATLGLNVDIQDRKSTWLHDAEHYIKTNAYETARAIYFHMLSVFPTNIEIWYSVIKFERKYGTKKQLYDILAKAVTFCPHESDFWLMRAKEVWLSGDVQNARKILDEAFIANPDDENIWLAAAKIEKEHKMYDRARNLLLKAREKIQKPRVFMKSALLERLLKNSKEELELLLLSVEKFPNYDKLWLMLAQYYANINHNQQNNENIELVRETYRKALKSNPNSIALWLNYSSYEINNNNDYGRARSILEAARLKHPDNDDIWIHSIRIERKTNNTSGAQMLQSKAFQACPKSGKLWAHAIGTDTRTARKNRVGDALSKCENDPYIFTAVAQVLWSAGKNKGARQWFERAIKAKSDWGDLWLYYYKFESSKKDNNNKANAILQRCQEADPRYGELWTRISKDDLYSQLNIIDICKKGSELIDINNIFKYA